MKSSAQFHTYIRGIILIGYALLVLKLFLTFNLQNFVAPKMHKYMYFSLGVFLVLGAVQVIRGTSSQSKDHSCDCEGHELPKGFLRSIFVYALFVFPIIIGFLLPDNLLDSSVAAKRGVKVGNSLFTTPPKGEKQPGVSPGEEKQSKQDEYEPSLGSYEEFPVEKDFEKLKELLGDQDKIIVRDEQYIQTLSIVDENLDNYIGKEIQLTGFVYKDEGFAKDEIVVSRFTVTCCVADASVYGILARDVELGKLEPDTWVNISAIIDKTMFNGVEMPVMKNSVFKVVDPPENPYVEEFFIKVE
jgi:putative membrane protein